VTEIGKPEESPDIIIKPTREPVPEPLPMPVPVPAEPDLVPA
jgi:hypothetical protein